MERLFDYLDDFPRVEIAGIHPRCVNDCGTINAARLRSVNVLESDNVNSPEFLDALNGLGIDILVSCNEKQILRSQLIGLPKLAAINLHSGALPMQRGGGGLYSAFINGEIAGITVHHLTNEIDSGDIILQQLVRIRDSETIQDIQKKFTILGPKMIIEAINLLIEGRAPRLPQDGHKYSYTPAMPESDNMIKWRESSRLIHNRVRARQSPVWSYTYHNGRKLYVKSTRLIDNLANYVGSVGQVIGRCHDGTVIKTGDNGLMLTEVFYDGEAPFVPRFRISTMLGINLYKEYERLQEIVKLQESQIRRLESFLGLPAAVHE